jgi:Ser-tRNA(Ala) deacylase AlaX
MYAFAASELETSLLACQRSAYLRQGMSRVLKCERLEASNSYRVLLDNSVLYPEGGGQPSDQGTVNGIPVSKVSKPTDANEVAALPTDAQATCVEVELSAPVDPDSLVECVVDWDRRYDFMQQHTAQVLI